LLCYLSVGVCRGIASERFVSHDDVMDVDFVAFRRPTRFDLTGVVNTSKEWLDTLEVRGERERDGERARRREGWRESERGEREGVRDTVVNT